MKTYMNFENLTNTFSYLAYCYVNEGLNNRVSTMAEKAEKYYIFPIPWLKRLKI